jgi:hypothetical protein
LAVVVARQVSKLPETAAVLRTVKRGVIGFVLVALAIAGSAVAAEQTLVMSAEPKVIGFASGGGALTLTGRLTSGRAGELIEIEGKECGSDTWRLIATDRTIPGGAWHASTVPTLRTTYRARWRDTVSEPAEILVRPGVRLDQRSRTRYSATMIASRFFRGAKGRFERFDRTRGAWVLVRRVTLSRQSAPRGAPWAYSGADFVARVPVRSLVRFVLPNDQTGECYLAGHSIQFNVR